MKKLILFIFLIYVHNINAQIITTIAGSNAGFSGDGGQAIVSKINYPMGITFDTEGNLYFLDAGNYRIRKISTSGIITTIAGTGVQKLGGNDGPAIDAQFNNTANLVFDPSGNLYVSDCTNNQIRKISPSGIITAVAGNGIDGVTGDGGQALSARISQPWGLAFDAVGNLYFAEYGNHCIRKVSAAGIITTVAGIGSIGYGGFNGDGIKAINAQLLRPTDIVFDKTGNLYICDEGNSRIRKVDASGIISTIAGSGSSVYGGDGGIATDAGFCCAQNIEFDSFGNLYIAGFGAVRMVNTLGIISTVAGDGTSGFSGDNGPANASKVSYPFAIAFDPMGNLYISDSWNHRLRKITNIVTSIVDFSNSTKEIFIYPNPTSGIFTIDSGAKEIQTIDLYDASGRKVFSKKMVERIDIDATDLVNGVYFITIQAGVNITQTKLFIMH